MTIPPPPSLGLRIVKTGLYILAGIVLILGLIAGISLLSSAERTIMNMLLPFQLMGSPAIQNAITPVLKGLFINLGIAVIVLTLIFSGLLYAVGRLVGHILHLEDRIARLETRS